MESSEYIKDKAMSVIDKFNELRIALVDGLLDCAVTSELKLWVMDILTENRLLPFGRWISDCPKSMDRWLGGRGELYIERYRTVSFREVLDYMTDNSALEHPELIDEFFNYIKEHRIIGTVVDW